MNDTNKWLSTIAESMTGVSLGYEEPNRDKEKPCKECGQPTTSFKCADCIIADKKNWRKKI